MKNIAQWKTTTIGILIMAVALVDMWAFEKLPVMGLGALGVAGILFLFAPDKILNVLLKKARNTNK
jgi:hypothetical protein